MKQTVFVEGKRFTLNQNDYLGEGGEGQVYQQGDTVFKLYFDNKKVISQSKIDELSALNLPNIIRPLESIYDGQGDRIGYTMQSVKDAEALARWFTTDHQQDKGITPEMLYKAIQMMRETTAFIHQQNCLIVDGNEMNYLVKPDSSIHFIDVDSYQTQNFQATAIMPSIRDWTVDPKNFSEKSDWFSFGIIACQLLLGIHPYKGKHNAYKRGDFENRVKDRVSIFNDAVRLPGAVRDMSLIPDNYRDWMKAVFEDGVRDAPPEMIGAVIAARSYIGKQLYSSARITLSEIQSFQDAIKYILVAHGKLYVQTSKELIQGNDSWAFKDSQTKVIVAPKGQYPILVKSHQGRLVYLVTKDNQVVDDGLEVNDLMVCNNRLYGLSNKNFYEFEVMEMGNNIKLLSKTNSVMPNASTLFDGILHENMLGTAQWTIPYAPDTAAQMHMKELDGKAILNARYLRQVAMAITIEDGEYIRWVFKFSDDHKTYNLVDRQAVDQIDMNFTVLERGLVIAIMDEGEMWVFDRRMDKDAINKIEDKAITTDIRLNDVDGKVYGVVDNKLYHVKLG